MPKDGRPKIAGPSACRPHGRGSRARCGPRGRDRHRRLGRRGISGGGPLTRHKCLETNATTLLVVSLVVLSVDGIVEIALVFHLDIIIEKMEGMCP